MNLQLINQHSTKLRLDMNLTEEQQIQIENKFSFKVYFSDDLAHCKAVLNTEVQYKDDPSMFNIVVENEGIFACEGVESDDDKKRAHELAYTLLFPYVQGNVATLAQLAGMPPIMIQMAKMKIDDIKIGPGEAD